MDAPAGEYSIFIKTLTGKVIEMRVEGSDDIRTLKLKVYDKAGIAPDAQRYIFSAKQLEDHQTLWSLGVRKESIVNLIVRQDTQAPPSAPPPEPVEEDTTPTSGSGGGASRRNQRRNNPRNQRQQQQPQQQLQQQQQQVRQPVAYTVEHESTLKWLWTNVWNIISAIWDLVRHSYCRLIARVRVLLTSSVVHRHFDKLFK